MEKGEKRTDILYVRSCCHGAEWLLRLVRQLAEPDCVSDTFPEKTNTVVDERFLAHWEKDLPRILGLAKGHRYPAYMAEAADRVLEIVRSQMGKKVGCIEEPAARFIASFVPSLIEFARAGRAELPVEFPLVAVEEYLEEFADDPVDANVEIIREVFMKLHAFILTYSALQDAMSGPVGRPVGVALAETTSGVVGQASMETPGAEQDLSIDLDQRIVLFREERIKFKMGHAWETFCKLADARPEVVSLQNLGGKKYAAGRILRLRNVLKEANAHELRECIENKPGDGYFLNLPPQNTLPDC